MSVKPEEAHSPIRQARRSAPFGTHSRPVLPQLRVLCARPRTVSRRSGSLGPVRVAPGLPLPSQRGDDGLASALTHAQSLSDADPERVAIRPGYPTLTRCSCHRPIYTGPGISEYRIPSGSLG